VSRQRLCGCPLDCQSVFDGELAVSGRTVPARRDGRFRWQQPDTGVRPTEKVSLMGRRLVSIAVLTLVLSAVGAVMAASGALADEKTATFTIQLSGAAEVCPTAPGTCGGPGTGTATITIDRNARTLCYTITTQNVALPLLAAHIHEAPVGEAGPVVVPLFTQPVNAATVGPTCLTDLDKNLLKDIIRNPENYYVNVHNAPFPNGAVRGQLA
jgi:CHRD domain